MIASRFGWAALWLGLGVLGSIASLGASRAAAQAATGAAREQPEPPGYRAAIDEAVSEYAAGRFAEARALFTRAHALMPNARTLRGLGMTEFELRGYAQSVRMLEAALASTIRPIAGDLRTETEALLARARGFVGRFKVTLAPATTQLSIDGAPATLSGDVLMLEVGDHTLEARAEGYVSIKQALRITGGEDTTINVSLQKQGAAVAPTAVANAPVPTSAPAEKPAQVKPIVAAKPAATAPAPAAPKDESSSVFSSPWFWAAAGVVVVGGGVAAGVILLGGDAETADPYAGDTGVLLRGP